MKKARLLSFLLSLCSIAMAWAQFAPIQGTMYALKVNNTDLYLDIQTLGINEANAGGTTNNISLNAKPCIIYFEEGANGKWKIKNAIGNYVQQASSRNWNVVIGTTPYEWSIQEATTDVYTIARTDGKYINVDAKVAGEPLFCDKNNGMQFTLVKYSSFKDDYHALKSPTGTYLSLTSASGSAASFQKEPTYVHMTPSADAYFIESKENANLFVGSSHNWNVTTDFALWSVSEADANGQVTISRYADPNQRLGHDGNTNAGTGIFTNVGSGCFKWIIEEYSSTPAVKYTLAISAPKGKSVTITYNNKNVEAGQQFDKDFNTDLFTASEISGYTWSIITDNDNHTITLVYTEAPSVDNPEAIVALINRIGGANTAKKFKFVLNPSLNSKHETFAIDRKNGKVLIEGTTLSAITTGIGWYLNHHAHINIAWNSLNEKTATGGAYADLSDLPLPSAREIHTSDAKYRYYLNYCTFGYSMTSWTWNRWQQEIDWMALHGINMPLQIVGLEEVWRKFLTTEKADGTRKYNYTDAEAKAFVAGPAFTAWWGMNNLEGWGGTNADGWGGVQDDAWYVRQSALAQDILTRQRELGIEPVLPGFSGMVPTNFTTKTGVPTDANGGKWAGGFQRPRIIDPTYSGFADIANDYYACLKAVMGESQYYSMDPFHEGGSISSGAYTEAYYAIYEAMEAAKSGSQWVIQQWQWDSNQKRSLHAVPAGRLIVLDLFSDGSPAFNSYNGYAPQEAVFCAIPNFGGRSGLMGRLNNVADNYFTYKAKYASIKGIGTAPEAIEQTPVTYDLIYQLPWMGSKPDVQAWVSQYALSRYGTANATVQAAWELLRQGPLNYGADAIQGPVEDVWAARPNLNAYPASAWGKTLNHAGGTYTKARRQMLIDATYKLLSQEEALSLEPGSIYESNYYYDLVEFGGAVMADYAYDLLLGIRDAKNANGTNDATYKARRDAFLALIADMDVFKGTNLNFRLGKWTQEARDAAAEVKGATTATPDWYEFNNARTLITTWSTPNTNLNDYSYRSWQGLLKDFYLPRWQHFFANDCAGAEYGYFEWNWAHGKQHHVGQTAISTTPLAPGEPGYSYSREPEGNAAIEAAKLLGKYIIPVTMADGTYYAYRYLPNDMSAQVTIIAQAGSRIDLTPYFGTLSGAIVSGDFIQGDATDLSAITIKGDTPDGSHIGTITLTDGTTLTFAVAINPAYCGVYYINYEEGAGRPLFIAYNTDKDNAGNVGYKLIGTGTYTTVHEADKLFTITPSGAGYTLSAQGKYLQSPNTGGWNHLMFSDNKGDAGVYLFEEAAPLGTFKMRSPATGGNIYVNDYDNLVFGNDAASKEQLSTFTAIEATAYPITIPASGATMLCLPFHVVMPQGMYAYDTTSGTPTMDEASGTCTLTLTPIAAPGHTLKSHTPVIIKAPAGQYALPILHKSNDAVGALSGSPLRGTLTERHLVPDAILSRFILSTTDEAALIPIAEAHTANPNSCWLEWPYADHLSEVQHIALRFADATSISPIAVDAASHAIYNVGGQRLSTPHEGINIINGKKIMIK